MSQKFILRCDDWLTGCRPIPSDISLMYEWASILEKYRIHYRLGIVPLTLNYQSVYFLQKSRYAVPALHGFSHRYHEKSEICSKNNDPFNVFSVQGTFNEFDGCSEREITDKIFMGKRYLELIFKTPCWDYIPPNNIIDEKTVRVLEKLHFCNVLSENPPPCETKLNFIKSDFYGKLIDMPSIDWNNVDKPFSYTIGLHCTWEVDDIRRNGLGWMKSLIKEKLT